MNLVLSNLRKEKNNCKTGISRCKYVLKKECHDFTIEAIYKKSMYNYEKYLAQIERAINILKNENNLETQKNK